VLRATCGERNARGALGGDDDDDDDDDDDGSGIQRAHRRESRLIVWEIRRRCWTTQPREP